MRPRGAGGGIRRAGLHHHDGLFTRDFSGEIKEAPAFPQAFDIQGDDAGVIVMCQELQVVLEVEIRLVAGADHLAQSHTPPRQRLHDARAQGAALAQEGHRAGGNVGGEPDADDPRMHVSVAVAVWPHEVQPGLARGRQYLRLEPGALAVHLGEARRYDDDGLDPFFGALAEYLRHDRRRHHDNRQLHRVGDVQYAFVGLYPLYLGGIGVHRISAPAGLCRGGLQRCPHGVVPPGADVVLGADNRYGVGVKQGLPEGSVNLSHRNIYIISDMYW